MKVTLDTNVLVRAILRDEPGRENALADILANAEIVAIPTACLCELVWVLHRGSRLPAELVARAIEALIEAPNVSTHTSSVRAGLAFLRSGGDFADAVIAREGERLGGEIFLTFDRKAARLSEATGIPARLLE